MPTFQARMTYRHDRCGGRGCNDCRTHDIFYVHKGVLKGTPRDTLQGAMGDILRCDPYVRIRDYFLGEGGQYIWEGTYSRILVEEVSIQVLGLELRYDPGPHLP